MMAELYVTKVSLSIKKGHFQNGDVLFYVCLAAHVSKG